MRQSLSCLLLSCLYFSEQQKSISACVPPCMNAAFVAIITRFFCKCDIVVKKQERRNKNDTKSRKKRPRHLS